MDAALSLYGEPQAPATTAITAGEVQAPVAVTPPAKSDAATLYGGPDEPAPPKQTSPTTPEQSAEVLYNEDKPIVAVNTPEAIKAMREADTDRKLYGAQGAYATAIPGDFYANLEGVDDATKAAAIAELREISYDLGAEPADVKQMVMLAKQNTANPPDAKTIAAWQEEATNRLVAEYGKNAGKALEDARALALRDPRVAKMLDQSGVGNHPEIVMRFVRLARDQAAKQRTSGQKRK